MTDLTPYIFGAITLVGVLYFLYNIFGDMGDVDLSADASGDNEFGLMLVAAFMSAFGAFGLLGTLSEWGLPLTLGVAVIAGLLVGRAALVVLRYVTRQQSTVITSGDVLIGATGRVTIDAPAGSTTEVIIEDGYVAKYAAREIDNHALRRGDHVDIVNVENGTLYVKKKRMG
jgi:membrane protein implicated in regulation of membrane protease activity